MNGNSSLVVDVIVKPVMFSFLRISVPDLSFKRLFARRSVRARVVNESAAFRSSLSLLYIYVS